MEIKKNINARLEEHSETFIQLGLVLALIIVYFSLEYKVYERNVEDLTSGFVEEEIIEDIPITERVLEIKPPPPPPPAPDRIQVVTDEQEIIETVLESTETDENEAVEVEEVEIAEIDEVVEEEEVIADVPFAIIEEAPIYPGCKGSKAERKKCLQEKIREHVNKKYNVALSEELGLEPGKKRVHVLFKIDHEGNIVDVKARGPHARLEKEAIRVVKLLPKMIPARQRGRRVGVKYALPITLHVKDPI